jgi:glycosyltransferase involved in cell wall biosynthesis
MPVPCTVAARSELAHVRVLAEALRAHGVRERLVAVILDDPDGEAVRPDEPFDVVAPEEVGAGAESGLLALEREALREQVKPRLLERLLAGGEPVLVLDPDVDVLGPLDDLAAAAAAGGVALVPGDGEAGDGVYRSGVLAAAGEKGLEFARWWADAEPALDGSGLQRLDAAPAAFAVTIVHDPGHGLAAWNLAERPLREGPTAGGAPLRTAVWRGFDPLRPYWLSEDVEVASDPVLAALLEDYAQRLLAAGFEAADELDWGYDALPGGIRLDRALRAVLQDAAARGVELGDPFTREGAERLLAWAAGPADHGAVWGLSRYLVELWTARPDLSRSFPDLETADGERYARWAVLHAAEENLPSALVPGAKEPGAPDFGVNVAGYLSSTLGTAEAARLYMTALRAAGVPLRMESLEPPRPPTNRPVTASTPPARPVPRELDGPADFPLNLVCVNAVQLPQFARHVGEDFFAGRRTVGVWAWETSAIPASWEPAFRWVDEIWTHSTYSAALIAARSPVPVVAVPPPVIAPEPPREPLALELPDGFTFLFAFDFLSTIERKNPVGLVEAFKLAFAPGEGPQLVLKAFNGDYKPEQLAQLRWAARGRDDIRLVDRWMPDEQRHALMARADCYVSLHRSEGFGLTMAEAMAMGKPVIATGYSGNLDFMDSSTAYLVEHRLVNVGPGVDIYPADGVWAEPDREHAAALMRRVVEQPEEARARGARAREDVLRRFSPEACGALARGRLEQLARRAPEAAAAPRIDGALALAERKAAYNPLAGVASSHPRDLAKRAALQAMRPYTFHQQELNGLLVDALREVRAQVAELEEMVAAQRRRTRRAEWQVRGLRARLDAEHD